MGEEREARILAQFTEELRSEPLPDVDWDALEERLMKEVQTASASSDRAVLPWALGLGGLAAAAAAALWLGSAPSATPQPHPVMPATTQPAAINGAELAIGSIVRADSEPVRVEHLGRAVWTLAPRSRGRLVSRGRYLTVALDQGVIRAEVVPGQAAESFAVEVHQTRVAAHGTVFRVTLANNQVLVQVSEGEVVVGSAEDRGRTRGFYLSAPAEGTFALDGARVGSVSTPPTSPSPEPPSRALLPAGAPPTPTTEQPLLTTSARPHEPEGPTADFVADQMVVQMRRCFAQHTEVQGSVHVSATSRLSVSLANGVIQSVLLDPPLAPDVEQCIHDAARTMEAPMTPGTQTVARDVWLSR